ncbi:MAG: TVP38/TMEM64 family protein [Egibacteraceae bacterium]
MRRYWSVAGAIVVLLLAGFLVVEGLGLPLLSDPTVPLEEAGPWAGFLALALLAVDAVLPVPSSLVMVALGAIYGPVLGIFLALLGRVLMALAGFAAGRRGGPLLNRLVSPEARIRADLLLQRWGIMAIMITRPVPLLAETVVILAGASSITWVRLAMAALVGSVPEAVLYGLSGAFARGLGHTAFVWIALLAFVGGFWVVTHWAERRLVARSPRP